MLMIKTQTNTFFDKDKFQTKPLKKYLNVVPTQLIASWKHEFI